MYMYVLAAMALSLMAGRLALVWTQGSRARKLLERAMAALEAEAYEDAEKNLRKVVKLAPIWMPARLYHAQTLYKLNRFKEAETQFAMAAKLEPRNAEGHLHYGMFLAHALPEKRDEAIGCLEKAVSLDPHIRTKLAHAHLPEPLRGHDRVRALLAPSRDAV